MTATRSALERYVATGDPESFRQLVEAYHGMVHATCRRVLREAAAVDDAVQETFWTLARRAAEVRGNLAAWLHTCAVNQALAQVRSEKARRAREQTAAAERRGEAVHADEGDPRRSWSDVRPILDEELGALDADLREAVVRHCLLGHPLHAIAQDAGVTKPAIHKRVQKGLAILRERLTRRGVVIGALLLPSALAHGAQVDVAPASAAQLAELAKVSLVPRAKAAAGGSAQALAAGVGAAALLIAIGAALWWNQRRPASVAPPAAETAAPTAISSAAAQDATGAAAPSPAPASTPTRDDRQPADAPMRVLQRADGAGANLQQGVPGFVMRAFMQAQPDGAFDPRGCITSQRPRGEEAKTAPPVWAHIDGRVFAAVLSPRTQPPDGHAFSVSYRMRMLPGQRQPARPAFPWLLASDPAAPIMPAATDDPLVALDLATRRWLAVEARFTPAPDGAGRWRQRILVDGRQVWDATYAATSPAFCIAVTQGAIDVAAYELRSAAPEVAAP